MTTIVSIEQGGTNANTTQGARISLSAANVAGDTFTGNLNVAAVLITQNVIPTSNNNYNLGSTEARYKDLWLSNSTIYLGAATISSHESNVIVPGLTVTNANISNADIADLTASTVNVTTLNVATLNATTLLLNNGLDLETQVNAAYTQANSAYAEANLKLNVSGGTINGSLNISGNLTITGNTKYTNVDTYIVSDPLIYLASNNETSDVVDIGFMGGHNTAGVYQHSGLVRDASDSTWYLFTGLAEEGHENNVVDFANTSLATLRANIQSFSINSASITVNGNNVWHSGNDGPGSGLDADTVDSIHANSFIRKDSTNEVATFSNITKWYSANAMDTASGSQASLEVYNATTGEDAFMAFHVSGDYAAYFGLAGDINDFCVGGWSVGATKHRVWHAGNDGPSSGLDADTVDGVQASSFHQNGSGNAMTCAEAYIHNWARTYGEEGLYSQDYGQHFYPDSGGFYWDIDGPLRVRSGYEGGIQGYLGYHDSNGFGFLHSGGSWWLNTQNNDAHLTIGGSQAYNAHSSVTSRRLMLGGSDADAQGNYYIGTNLENYGGTYNKLDLRWHTGIRMGAQQSYGGIRFFDTEDLGTLRFHIEGTSGYLYKYVWMYTNTTGIYSDTNGWHIEPTPNTYGSGRIRGSKNSYGGWRCEYSGVQYMHDSGGNGGMYREANGRWMYYHNIGNNSLGIGSSSTSSSHRLYINDNSFIANMYANAFFYASDRKFKDNINTISSPLELLSKFRGVTYTKKDDDENKTHMGVIAQEVEEIFPSLVNKTKNHNEEEYLSVNYGNFAGLFIEAIKEQTNIINSLKQEIELLKSKLECK